MRKAIVGLLAAILVFCGAMPAHALDSETVAKKVTEAYAHGTFEFGRFSFSVTTLANDLAIIHLMPPNQAEVYGLLNMATGEILAPFAYDAMYAMPDDTVFAVQGKATLPPSDIDETDALQYFEIDYTGHTTPIHIDGVVHDVDPESGYVILSKPKLFPHGLTISLLVEADTDAPLPSAPPKPTELWDYVYALLDNHYQPIFDYILDSAHTNDVLRFRDGMAIVRTGRDLWNYTDAPGGYGDGSKVGVIDLTGAFLLPPQYGDIRYLGNGCFEARTFPGQPRPDMIGPFFTFPIPPSKLSSDWARDAINSALSQQLIPTNLQFNYTQSITRAEFCALAVALYERETGAIIIERATFTDSTDINVQKLGGLGIVGGTGNGAFSPDASLSREQAAVILANLAAAMDKPLEDATADFADMKNAADWAVAAIGQVQEAGIMGGIGDNLFAPKTAYTREQSIVTMLNFSAFLQ